MSNIAEIEAAIDRLTSREKEELLLILVGKLRAEGREAPPPRDFTAEQIGAWIEEDERDLRRFREGK